MSLPVEPRDSFCKLTLQDLSEFVARMPEPLWPLNASAQWSMADLCYTTTPRCAKMCTFWESAAVAGLLDEFLKSLVWANSCPQE